MPASKISAALEERLSRLGATDTLRAIVLLALPEADRTLGRAERVRETKDAAAVAVREIDDILAQAAGRRTGEPNALGSIAVETTVAGIRALARSEQVRAILEDQRMSSIDVR
jgi:hypothetical protein